MPTDQTPAPPPLSEKAVAELKAKAQDDAALEAHAAQAKAAVAAKARRGAAYGTPEK